MTTLNVAYADTTPRFVVVTVEVEHLDDNTTRVTTPLGTETLPTWYIEHVAESLRGARISLEHTNLIGFSNNLSYPDKHALAHLLDGKVLSDGVTVSSDGETVRFQPSLGKMTYGFNVPARKMLDLVNQTRREGIAAMRQNNAEADDYILITVVSRGDTFEMTACDDRGATRLMLTDDVLALIDTALGT